MSHQSVCVAFSGYYCCGSSPLAMLLLACRSCRCRWCRARDAARRQLRSARRTSQTCGPLSTPWSRNERALFEESGKRSCHQLTLFSLARLCIKCRCGAAVVHRGTYAVRGASLSSTTALIAAVLPESSVWWQCDQIVRKFAFTLACRGARSSLAASRSTQFDRGSVAGNLCALAHTHTVHMTHTERPACSSSCRRICQSLESVARVVSFASAGPQSSSRCACSLAHTRGFVAAVINIQRLRCLLFRGPLSLPVNKDCRAYVRSEAACTLNMYEQGSSERKNDGKAASVLYVCA